SANLRSAACDTHGVDRHARQWRGARLLLAPFLLAADDDRAGAETGIHDDVQPRPFADCRNDCATLSGDVTLPLSSRQRHRADCVDLRVYSAAALGWAR